MENRYYLIYTGVALLSALGLFVAIDLAAALSVYWQVTLSYALFWLVVGYLLLRNQNREAKYSLLTFFLVAIVAVYMTNWDSRKPFLKDFFQIEVGMSTAEAEAIMTGYPKYVNPASKLGPEGEVLTGSISYRHTIRGWGDSDIGLLLIEEGRVVEARFYPD